MLIIIDGYNLLKQVLAHDRITETERTAFVNLLGRYSAKRGHKIQIVFDRGPCHYPMKEKHRGVTVVFSGELQTADDIIIAFCKEHPTKDLLVVTGDRAIISAVSGGNCEVVAPPLFYQKVKQTFEKSAEATARQRGHVVKTAEDADSEIDAIMLEAAGMKVPEKDEGEEYQAPRHHQPRGKELSKKERKKVKKIDKL